MRKRSHGYRARGGPQFFTISSRSCYGTFMPDLAPFGILSSVMSKGGVGALSTATFIGVSAYEIGRQYRCALGMSAGIFLMGLIPCLFI
jgi:hypothetical protein